MCWCWLWVMVLIECSGWRDSTSPHRPGRPALTSLLHSAPPRARIPAVRYSRIGVSRSRDSVANQVLLWLQMSKQNAGRSIVILQGRRCQAELPKEEVQTR
jgi:hypothetical protein